MVAIHAIQKTTLQDFPEKPACIVFLAGCNFRCVYCHNPAAVKGKANISEEKFFSFLESRKGKLQGVVVSGGEPTIQPGIVRFIAGIKEKGFAVKLDTNGSRPEILKELLQKNLLDYIAMDVKAPFSKYKDIALAKGYAKSIKKSIKLVMGSGIDYEFRTTCHPMLSKKDIQKTAEQVKGAKKYFLQEYVEGKTLNPQRHLWLYNAKTLNELKEKIEKNFQETSVR